MSNNQPHLLRRLPLFSFELRQFDKDYFFEKVNMQLNVNQLYSV